MASGPGWFTTFTNCRYCLHGELVEDHLVVSEDTGTILKRTGYIGGDIVDLEDAIIAPGFLELHSNGVNGFHFTQFESEESYEMRLKETSSYFVTKGVTGFWATVPTVKADEFQTLDHPLAYLSFHYCRSTASLCDSSRTRGSYAVQLLFSYFSTVYNYNLRIFSVFPKVSTSAFTNLIHSQILPFLKPRAFKDGASLLGAHAEGPYLTHSKKGAHTASLFHLPDTNPASIYGASNLRDSVKLVTLAPELPASTALIKSLVACDIRVSLGHSAATYEQGLDALRAGATCLTHTLNAMSPWGSREPGLAGLIALPEASEPKPPYYSIISDGHHIHQATATLLHRAAPTRSMLITDSLELSGLPDGTYPGHTQIPFPQTKFQNRVTIAGTDTLVGGCASLAECVKNLMAWNGCGIAEAVRCATENIAAMMGIDGPDGGRGVLLKGRRADFVVLSEEADVLETWVAGRKVWEKED